MTCVLAAEVLSNSSSLSFASRALSFSAAVSAAVGPGFGFGTTTFTFDRPCWFRPPPPPPLLPRGAGRSLRGTATGSPPPAPSLAYIDCCGAAAAAATHSHAVFKPSKWTRDFTGKQQKKVKKEGVCRLTERLAGATAEEAAALTDLLAHDQPTGQAIPNQPVVHPLQQHSPHGQWDGSSTLWPSWPAVRAQSVVAWSSIRRA